MPEAGRAPDNTSLPEAGIVQQAPQPAAQAFLTIPQGTRIPLILTAPINTHSTHAGDAVRAQTSFPVSVHDQLAIPSGTYLEGQITAVHRPNASNRPAFQMRFTRLIFASGYAVPLTGATAEAKRYAPPSRGPQVQQAVSRGNSEESDRQVSAATFKSGDDTSRYQPISASYALPAAAAQQPPPLPKLGPSKGEVIGISVGVLAAVLIVGLVVAQHHHNDLYLDAGAPIEMILQSPLTLDASQIAAASSGAAPGN
jgi:type IV secretory pathway VirB10-like protein